jgi:hypothetical protein
MKAIYIGAGIDTRPIEYFKEIKLFYYFDSKPYSEFGIKQSSITNEDGINGFSRPNFIPSLDENMKKIDMLLVNVYDNLRIYSDNNQMVYYYTNTAIPENYNIIKEKIKNANTLIVAGHDPDSIFLEDISNKMHFIGIYGTFYGEDKNYPVENTNSILYRINNDNIRTKFNKFSFLSSNNKINQFNTWDKFISFYEKN